MIFIRECLAGLISPLVVSNKPRWCKQLLQFAHTELYTSFDIATVAARQEPTLRAEMERHARDERGHYEVFKNWAREVAPYVGANYADPRNEPGLAEASVRQATEQPAAPNQRFKTLFEYMAYLFISETRPVLQFTLYRWLNPWNRRCWKQIPILLVDEKRHVRYSLHYAWREYRAAPWASTKGLGRVLVYVLRQDVIDLLKLVQTVGSSLMSGLIYFGLITPYALLLRCLGMCRRGTLRSWSGDGPVSLDEAYWKSL